MIKKLFNDSVEKMLSLSKEQSTIRVSKETDVLAIETFKEAQQKIFIKTDRLFVGLMVAQWIFGVICALVISPRTWSGEYSEIHIHLWAAIFLGGAIASLPIYLGIKHSGKPITRHVIAFSQALYSAILIHLTGGRIETHFHVFGSLAFLSFYRDWRVLITATIIIATENIITL